MSDREDIILQADDVTIVQGEKPKDYNVIVTNSDNAPLSNIPVTIAFYNADFSFEREATTNQYGVASVPMYLTGDSWFVDVHFKGNESYNPQLVTREINIEKFERLESYINSENLTINIDVITMNGIYYTIYLKDSYDRPIIHEPVRITVQQTGVEEPQTYLNVVLKTDEDGKIEVPFLSHNENVVITTQYYGCTRYKPCLHSDLVMFEDVDPRNDIEFRLVAYEEDFGDPYIQYRVNNGNWTDFVEEDRPLLKPIVNYEDDNRTSFVGWEYTDSLKDGTYVITIKYDGFIGGDDIFANTYPFCRTFTFENKLDTRKNLIEWVESQWGGEYIVYILGRTSSAQGYLSTIKIALGWKSISDIIEVIVTPYDESLQNASYNDIKEAELYSFFTVPTSKWYDSPNWFGEKTEIETDIWNPKLNDFMVAFVGHNFNFCTNYEKIVVPYPAYAHTNAEDVTLSQTGFGDTDYTYQEMKIIAENSNAPMHEKLNDYYSLKLLNDNTKEEFYFYGYLADNVTPVNLSFNLGIGDWTSTLISQATEKYNGAILCDTATLTIDSQINPPTKTIIADGENYIDLGTDTPTFEDETISTATTDDDIHSIMALEFTNSNYYKLQFNAEITGDDSTIIYGADPTLTTLDGLLINPNYITLYNDDTEMDTVFFDTPILNQGSNVILIQKYGTKVTVFANDVQVYQTDLLSWSTFGIYQNATGSAMELSTFTLEPYVATDITPAVSDYDGTVFGSNIHLEIRDNQLNLIDYGMLPQGAIGGGKVILNDVPLQNANEYAIQLEMRYNNTRFERLNNLTGQMQMRVYEDISTSDSVKDYAKTLCSPMPVPNSKTVFTRHSDEGTLYFVKDPLDANSIFLSNAYNQYKGGVEITSETGVSLFNLDNAFSPVFVGNELVRAEFHRRSGFIRLSRYDEETGNWVNVNTLKLKNYPQLSLNEYNDDYAEIQFGQTVWKFYRGRPFIIVNHEKDDLRIMDLVDRVYCETVENQRGMGYIEEHDANCSIFNPQLSIQQFKQELHIGENIRLDNFELYEADANNNIGEVATDSQMGILSIDNDNALQIYKDDTRLALNFPSYSHYVERINSTFTLSIDYFDCPFENITIKARGFDERGAVPIKTDIQYGIWEQAVNVTVDTTAPDKISATFTDCPAEVKYLDFVIFFNGSNSTDIIMKDIMYYEGDAILNHETDTSRIYAEEVEIHFADTYFANIYNEKDNAGLCVARPYQEPFSLRSIYASKETVLIPYMKRAAEWDKPSQVFLEYLNANKQIIDIDWEN